MPHAETENEMLRRRIRNMAVTRALGVLRDAHREQFDAYWEHWINRGFPRRQAYAKARGDIREAYRLEYETNLLAIEAGLKKAYGYESQAHVGRAQRWNRLDTSDTSEDNGT